MAEESVEFLANSLQNISISNSDTVTLISQPLQGEQFENHLEFKQIVGTTIKGQMLLTEIVDDFCNQLVKNSTEPSKFEYFYIANVKKILEKIDINNFEDKKLIEEHFQRLKIKETEFVFFPIHTNGANVGHYFIIVADIINRKLTVFNSVKNENHYYKKLFKPILEFLQAVYNDNDSKWIGEVEYKSPQQEDGSSCGLFVIYHVIRILSKVTCEENGFSSKMCEKLRDIIILNYDPENSERTANHIDVYQTLSALAFKKQPSLNSKKAEDISPSTIKGSKKDTGKLFFNTVSKKQSAVEPKNAGLTLPWVNLHKLDMELIKMHSNETPDNLKEEQHELKRLLKEIEFPDSLVHMIVVIMITGTKKYTFRQSVRLDEEKLVSFTNIMNENEPDEPSIYENNLKSREYPLFCTSSEANEDSFLKHFNIRCECSASPISSIIFIPIHRELYAITSYHGWSTLHRYADLNFHSKIPIRILDNEGAVCVNAKSVFVGSYRNKSVTYSKKVDLKNLELGAVCETFSAFVNNKINQQLNLCSQSNICVDVGCSRLKFRTEMSFTEIVGLTYKLQFVHLSSLYESSSSGLERIIFRVDKKTVAALDQQLNMLINLFLMGTEDNITSWIDRFDICHKLTENYSKAREVSIHYRRQKYFLLPNPTFREVCQSARWFNILEEQDDFLKCFKLAYYIGNGRDTKDRQGLSSLGEYLNGIFYSNHCQKHFWRIGKNWYSVSEEFIMTVQRRFQQILNDHLLSLQNEVEEIGLFHPWPHCPKIDECDYNLLYQNQQGYYVGDKTTPRSIEYFDIIYDKNNKSYLYHVKHGFDHSTRDACSQLRNSFEMLTGMNSETADDVLEKTNLNIYIEKNIFTRNEALTLLGLGGDEPNQLVYVLGLLSNDKLENHNFILDPGSFSGVEPKKASRSLYLEKDIKLIIEKTYISSYLSKNSETAEKLLKIYGCQTDELNSRIETALVKENFISFRTDGTFGVKARLLLCKNKLDFKCVLPNGTKNLPLKCQYNMAMLLRFTTYFDSFGAKLEIVRLVDTSRLNKDNFKIIEILSEIS